MPFRSSSLALSCAIRSCSYTSNIARVLDFFRIYYMQMYFLQIRQVAETNHTMRFMEKSHRYIRAPCTWRFRTWSQYATRYLSQSNSLVSSRCLVVHCTDVLLQGRNYIQPVNIDGVLIPGALLPARHCRWRGNTRTVIYCTSL